MRVQIDGSWQGARTAPGTPELAHQPEMMRQASIKNAYANFGKITRGNGKNINYHFYDEFDFFSQCYLYFM
jgi:hypothetical protein